MQNKCETGAAPDNPVDVLSTDTLASLSKLNRDNFIHSFIKEQRSFHQLFAKEGDTYVQTWSTDPSRTNAPSPERKSRSLVHHSTPLLKPRNPNLPTSTSAPDPPPLASILKQASKQNTAKTQHRKSAATGEGLVEKVTRKTDQIRQESSTRRKRAASERSCDTDAEDRLKQRKERKRVKREIVKPKDTAHDSLAGKNGGKKANKGRVSAGLALMHGFQATNVGKSRLTAPVPVGVFKKGKASNQTSVSRKKTRPEPRDIHFSELTFLRNDEPHKNPSSIAERSECSQDTRAGEQPKGSCKKSRKKQDREPRSAAKTSSSEAKSQRDSVMKSQEEDEDDRPSVVYSSSWVIDPAEFPQSTSRPDAERSVLDRVLAQDRPSRKSESAQSDSAVSRSLLLNTRNVAWANQVIPTVSSTAGIPPARELCGSQVSSLMPSDSASQLPAPRMNQPVQQTSKYFEVRQPTEMLPKGPRGPTSVLSARGSVHVSAQSVSHSRHNGGTLLVSPSSPVDFPSHPSSPSSSLTTGDHDCQRDFSSQIDETSPRVTSRFAVEGAFSELDTQLDHTYINDAMRYSSPDEQMDTDYVQFGHRDTSDNCSCSSCNDGGTCIEEECTQDEVPPTELFSSSTHSEEAGYNADDGCLLDEVAPWNGFNVANHFIPANAEWSGEEQYHDGSDVLSVGSGADESMFAEDDDSSTDEPDRFPDNSPLGGFVEGRQLLLHQSDGPVVARSGQVFLGIAQVEEMVARDLRSHWLPQRR